MWLSLVERCVRDAEVAGSNPVTPTKRNCGALCSAVLFLSEWRVLTSMQGRTKPSVYRTKNRPCADERSESAAGHRILSQIRQPMSLSVQLYFFIFHPMGKIHILRTTETSWRRFGRFFQRGRAHRNCDRKNGGMADILVQMSESESASKLFESCHKSDNQCRCLYSCIFLFFTRWGRYTY